MGILNLNDDMIKYWNDLHPMNYRTQNPVFCAYWHKYCMGFSIGISIIKPVTYQKAYNKFIYFLLKKLLKE